jgi:hypothetical protein
MSLSICSLLLSKERRRIADAMWQMIEPSSEFGNPFVDTVSQSPQEAVQKKHELEEKPK